MNILSTDYLQKFRCLAQECEDNCCQRWSVRLDRSHYEKIRQLGTSHPDLQELIDQAVHLLPPGEEDTSQYAYIDMDEKGYCPFLNSEELCRLHLAGGIDVLGNTCANYPRVIYQIDDRLEIIGALSCPELTRLCFQSSHPNQLIQVDEDILPRREYILTHRIDSHSGSYYERRFPFIRDRFLQIAAWPEYNSKQKLYLLAYLGERLSNFYNNTCDEQIEQRLLDELERFSTPAVAENLFARMQDFEDHTRNGLITVQSILSIRIHHYQQEALSTYIDDIIKSYHLEAPLDVEVESLYQAYMQRKTSIMRSVKSQIEDYLARHLFNCLLREWFIRFPDPYSYIQMLTVRQAMLRFLLYSHPGLYQWTVTEHEHMQETINKVVEEISVELFYLFSRSIEHDIAFLQNIYSALMSENMMNLDTTLSLLKGV